MRNERAAKKEGKALKSHYYQMKEKAVPPSVQ